MTSQIKSPPLKNCPKTVIDRAGLDCLFDSLRVRGFTVVGPTVRDGAIIYDNLGSTNDLPMGWTDEQEAGSYRLKKRSDKALFGYTVGPHSWKKYLFPPRQRLWMAKRQGRSFSIENNDPPENSKFAFIGVRSCELHAIGIQDRVFIGDKFIDPVYKSRREQAFIVAVNCGQAGGACFCASMNTGPKAESGFDLALTEILNRKSPYFVVEVGSAAGAEVMGDIPQRQLAEKDEQAAEAVVAGATSQMGRAMEVEGIRELLPDNPDHPRWEEVAKRCLSCANCTMACPTCFCSTVEDTTDLTGDHAERWKRWDSCFTMDFSYIHGGFVRQETKSRYRHWITHKLSTWHNQFGSSGCVGCGRCITWCPVGIDITEEVGAIRASLS